MLSQITLWKPIMVIRKSDRKMIYNFTNISRTCFLGEEVKLADVSAVKKDIIKKFRYSVVNTFSFQIKFGWADSETEWPIIVKELARIPQCYSEVQLQFQITMGPKKASNGQQLKPRGLTRLYKLTKVLASENQNLVRKGNKRYLNDKEYRNLWNSKSVEIKLNQWYFSV